MISPGVYVGCGALPLLGRVVRLTPADSRRVDGAMVLQLRTQWRGFGDGVGALAWWPLSDLFMVDIARFRYCPLADRYYAEKHGGAL